MKKIYLLLAFVMLCIGTKGQNIYQIAGDGGSNADTVLATSASLSSPGITTDNQGNLIIANQYKNKIQKVVMSSGMLYTIAGTGGASFNGDSLPARLVNIGGPMFIAVDQLGNIYFYQETDWYIRKIDILKDSVFIVAGTGHSWYNGDSLPSRQTNLGVVQGFAVDAVGNIYFVADYRIRKVDKATDKIYTIAGTGVQGYNGDGIPAITAQLSPRGLAVDSAGNIYIADDNNDRIRKIDINTGLISTIAGTGVAGYNGEGIKADTAQINDPNFVCIDKHGNLFVSVDDYRVRKIDTAGIVTTIAGNGLQGSTGDGGAAVLARIMNLNDLTVDNCGNVYLADTDDDIRKVTSYNPVAIVVRPKCFNSCDGTLDASAVGGVSPYSYSWNQGLGAGASHIGICAGNYRLTVIDSTGCPQYLPVTVTQPTALNAIVNHTDATCNANGIASVNVGGGTQPYSYLWTSGSTTSQATGLIAGTYSVDITDSGNCVLNKQVTVNNSVVPFSSAPICMVTVDSLSQSNIVFWDTTSFGNIDSFIVYREIATNNYQPIARLPHPATGQFVDTVRNLYFPNTGDPNTGTYRYKIQMRDSCGSYSSLSPYHNTIFFFNNSGVFTWPQLYSIEGSANPVSSYVLLRDDNSTGSWHSIGSVSGTQQFIIDPQYSLYENTASWRVETQWGIVCDYGHNSLSNVYQRPGVTSISNVHFEASIMILPNPTNGKISVSANLPIEHVEVSNILGEKMLSISNSKHQNSLVIDITSFSKGVYFLNVNTEAGVIIKKIIKE